MAGIADPGGIPQKSALSALTKKRSQLTTARAAPGAGTATIPSWSPDSSGNLQTNLMTTQTPMTGALQPSPLTMAPPAVAPPNPYATTPGTVYTGTGGGGGDGAGGASPTPTSYGVGDVMGLLARFKPQDVQREVGASPEDERGAQSAAYGSAADRIRNIGRGGASALKTLLTRRGVSGDSGVAAKAMTLQQNNVQGQLGDVVRQQATESLARSQAVNDRDLAANVGQRGQDMSQSDWMLSALPNVLALLRAGVSPN